MMIFPLPKSIKLTKKLRRSILKKTYYLGSVETSYLAAFCGNGEIHVADIWECLFYRIPKPAWILEFISDSDMEHRVVIVEPYALSDNVFRDKYSVYVYLSSDADNILLKLRFGQ